MAKSYIGSSCKRIVYKWFFEYLLYAVSVCGTSGGRRQLANGCKRVPGGTSHGFLRADSARQPVCRATDTAHLHFLRQVAPVDTRFGSGYAACSSVHFRNSPGLRPRKQSRAYNGAYGACLQPVFCRSVSSLLHGKQFSCAGVHAQRQTARRAGFGVQHGFVHGHRYRRNAVSVYTQVAYSRYGNPV